jgi:hypothetical protein
MTPNELKQILNDIIPSVLTQSNLRKIGLETLDRVRVRTRLGRGVKSSDSEPQASHKLPVLKDSTVQRRQRLRKEGGLTGPNAIPSKSGLNRSGKLLNRMHTKISGNTIIIKLDSYGESVVKHLLEDDPDWEFLNLSKAEVKSIVYEFEKLLTDELKRRLAR